MPRNLSGAGPLGQAVGDRLLQLRDDRGRRRRRRHDADIARGGEILDAALDEGRNFGRQLRALGRGDRDDVRLAAFVQRQRGGEFRHRRLDVAADQIGHQRAAALVGDMRELAPVAALKRSSVMCEALPTPLVATLIGAFFDSAMNSGSVLASTLSLRMMHVRHVAGQRHRREILQRIVAELGLHERIDGERPVRADEQRVAVGRGARDRLRRRCCRRRRRGCRPPPAGRARRSSVRRRCGRRCRHCRRARTARSDGSAGPDRRRRPRAAAGCSVEPRPSVAIKCAA